MLTAYDATFARQLQLAGLDCILVGDSLGMVIQGHDSTLPVTIEDMAYHISAVSKGAQGPLILADMPFMSCATEQDAMTNSRRLMQAGAHMLKIEGGQAIAPVIEKLVSQGIPICGHLGLRPQFVNQIGGYKVQGKTPDTVETLQTEANLLVQAGISMLVLECIPAALAAQLSKSLPIPVIGIGAGNEVDGQVLVLHDLLGLSEKMPKFAHNFLAQAEDIPSAITAYIQAVKSGDFPSLAHSF